MAMTRSDALRRLNGLAAQVEAHLAKVSGSGPFVSRPLGPRDQLVARPDARRAPTRWHSDAGRLGRSHDGFLGGPRIGIERTR